MTKVVKDQKEGCDPVPEKCPENCPLIPRVDALERENSRHTETHKEIFRRLNDVEKDNAVQEAHYTSIIEKLDALTAKLEALESKPGKRWESLIDKAIWAVAAAVIAFLLARIGL